MTIEKWNAKAEKLFSAFCEKTRKKTYYFNTDDDFLFSDNYRAFRIPGYQIWKSKYSRKLNEAPSLERYFEPMDNHRLVTNSEMGTINGTKVRKLTNEDGISALVKDAFLRDYPKSALLYVSGPCMPVLVVLMDPKMRNGAETIGVVMPIRSDSWIPDDKGV